MADNFDGTRFFLPGHRASAPLRDLLKWQFAGGRARWPKRVTNGNFPPPPHRIEGDALHVTWIGQATALIQTAGLNILTDPFFSDRASPVPFAGPRRVRPPGVALAALPPIDVVLVSHNHYDHMDLPSLAALSRSHKPLVVTPLGNARYMARAMPRVRFVELNWGEALTEHDVRFTLTPALHWSKRSFADTNMALWGAFVIETTGGMIYFAGDTGFGEGQTFRAVRDRFGPPRLSLLPIGAYEPRWFMKAQHMNPEEAVAAHQLLESRCSIAIHHATIQLTDEALEAPAAALAQARTAAGLSHDQFRDAAIGEPLVIP